MKRQPGHVQGTASQDGPLIAKSANLSAFTEHRANGFLLFKLNKRLKIFRSEDGWLAKGRQGHLWEWGKHKLGFTVRTANMITIARAAGFRQRNAAMTKQTFHVIGLLKMCTSLLQCLSCGYAGRHRRMPSKRGLGRENIP
jgi:hypothetical protein